MRMRERDRSYYIAMVSAKSSYEIKSSSGIAIPRHVEIDFHLSPDKVSAILNNHSSIFGVDEDVLLYTGYTDTRGMFHTDKDAAIFRKCIYGSGLIKNAKRAQSIVNKRLMSFSDRELRLLRKLTGTHKTKRSVQRF